jgi:hypothetical protein
MEKNLACQRSSMGFRHSYLGDDFERRRGVETPTKVCAVYSSSPRGFDLLDYNATQDRQEGVPDDAFKEQGQAKMPNLLATLGAMVSERGSLPFPTDRSS